MFDPNISSDDLLRLAISLLCGSILGFEREYKSKSAGFRTLILITLGSTIFTLVSQHVESAENYRVASTVVTGIGFIGAGVIFKEGFNVSGLTTAALIWVTAALGMLNGIGYNMLAVLLSVLVFIILSLFHYLEELIDSIHYRMKFNIVFDNDENQFMQNLQDLIESRHIKSNLICISKKEQKLTATLMLSGNKKRIMALSEYLISLPEIRELTFG